MVMNKHLININSVKIYECIYLSMKAFISENCQNKLCYVCPVKISLA